MSTDLGFKQFVAKNIERDTAFCVRGGDGLPGNSLLGGILWSPKRRASGGFLLRLARAVKVSDELLCNTSSRLLGRVRFRL